MWAGGLSKQIAWVSQTTTPGFVKDVMNCTSHPLPRGEKIGLSNTSNGSPPLKPGTVHPPLIAKSPESQNALPLLKVVALLEAWVPLTRYALVVFI